MCAAKGVANVTAGWAWPKEGVASWPSREVWPIEKGCGHAPNPEDVAHRWVCSNRGRSVGVASQRRGVAGGVVTQLLVGVSSLSGRGMGTGAGRGVATPRTCG